MVISQQIRRHRNRRGINYNIEIKQSDQLYTKSLPHGPHWKVRKIAYHKKLYNPKKGPVTQKE